MIRKIFKSGNSLVIALPKAAIKQFGWQEGSEISVIVDADYGRVIIEPVAPILAEIDPAFAQQLHEFIEQYRPALMVLAND